VRRLHAHPRWPSRLVSTKIESCAGTVPRLVPPVNLAAALGDGRSDGAQGLLAGLGHCASLAEEDQSGEG